MSAPYAVKCEECKATIRMTDNVRESSEGGTCDNCRDAWTRREAYVMARLQGKTHKQAQEIARDFAIFCENIRRHSARVNNVA
jgi:hypothetical protein